MLSSYICRVEEENLVFYLLLKASYVQESGHIPGYFHRVDIKIQVLPILLCLKLQLHNCSDSQAVNKHINIINLLCLFAADRCHLRSPDLWLFTGAFWFKTDSVDCTRK